MRFTMILNMISQPTHLRCQMANHTVSDMESWKISMWVYPPAQDWPMRGAGWSLEVLDGVCPGWRVPYGRHTRPSPWQMQGWHWWIGGRQGTPTSLTDLQQLRMTVRFDSDVTEGKSGMQMRLPRRSKNFCWLGWIRFWSTVVSPLSSESAC